MGTTFKRLGLSELLPRYVFAEGLYARRRVLEIGAVATTRGESARFLLTRGARSVLACDADVAAVDAANKASSTQGLRYRANVFDDLEGGSFDVVMVADLAPYVRAPELLRELTRLLSRGGILIGGLRNPAGLALSMVMEAEEGEPPPTWGQLLDALSSHFPSVEVATQSPVLGYQLAFERGDGLQVDGSLAEATEAAYFVAIAGHEPVRAVDPTWVQLPPEPLAYTGGKLEESARRAKDWQERTERMKELLERAKKDVGTRESDLKDVREQLLGAREGVARLTVQLEELSKRPKALEQQDELAGRIRRLEAELGVARERAQDAEGRVHASRAESDAQARAQKDAAVEAIAAQEIARLERSRREELVTQLEDARTRLAAAYEQQGKLQDELANGRVELERTRLQADRIVETLNVRERELATAKEREVKLAEARSEALSAIEVLEGQLEQTRARSGDALAQLERKESERLSAMRSAELELQSRMRFEQDLGRAQAELATARALVQQLEGERPAFDTELQEAKAGAHRLARDIEVLAGSERTWRAMAGELESRLANTQANVEALSEQLSEAESAKEAEVARYRRLEKDLSTAVGAERSAREQAEVALASTRHDVERLTAEARGLVEERDGLNEKIAELEGKRSSIAGQAGELEGRVKELEAQQIELTKALAESRESEAALRQESTKQAEQFALERARLTSRVEEVGGAYVQAQSLVSGLDLKIARLTAEAAEALKKGTDAEALLQERVDALSQELATRVVERDQLAVALREVNAELIEEEARAQSLEADLGEHKALLALAESESNERKASIDALTAKLDESEKRFQSTDVELHGKISALEEKDRAQAAAAAAEKAALEEMLRKGQAVLDRSRAEAQEQAVERAQLLQAHRDQLAALSSERTSEIAALRAEHRLAIEALDARQAALTEENARAQRESQQRVEELQKRIDGLASELEQARREHQAKSGEISSELELAQQKHRREVEAITGELEQARAEHQRKLEASAAELEQVRAAHQRKLDENAAELEQARTEHQRKLEASAAELEQVRAEHQRKLDENAAELAQVRADRQQTSESSAVQIEQVRAEHQRKLEASAAELEQVRAEQQRALEAKAAELEQLRAEQQRKSEASAAELEQVRAEQQRALDASAAELQRTMEAGTAALRERAEQAAAELARALSEQSAQAAAELERAVREKAGQDSAELERVRTELSEKIAASTAEAEQVRAAQQRQFEANATAVDRLRSEHHRQLEQVRSEQGQQTDARLAELEKTRAEQRQQSEARIAELEQARDEQRIQADARIAELEKARATLKQQSDENAAEVVRVGAELRRQAEENAADLERMRSEQQQALDARAGEIEKLREAVQKGQRALDEARSDAQLTTGELASARQVLETDLAAAKAEAAELEAKLRGAEGEVSHLQAEVAEGVDARLAEQALREATQLERDASKDRITQLETALQQAKDEAGTARERLTSELTEVRAEVARHVEAFAALQTRHDTAARELEEAAARLVSTTAELSQARERQEETARALEKAQTQATELQALTPGLVKAREEASAKHAALEEAIAKERASAAEELQARKAEHQQQLAERETIAQRAAEEAAVAQRRALDEAAATHRQELEARDASHRQEVEARAADAQKALTEASELQRKETDTLKDQLGTVKEDRDKWRGTVERAQSEARGHQSGKLGLQKELDKVREELATLRASSAIAGGESAAMAEAREQAEQELNRLRAKLSAAETELPKAQSRRDELEAELPRVRAAKDELDAELQKTLTASRELEDAAARAKEEKRVADEELARARDKAQALEAELSAVRGTAQGSTSDLETALGGRRQAEELLLALRTKYGELQDNYQHVRTAASDLPRLKEEVLELRAEAQMLEAERERLSTEVERLEKIVPAEPAYAPGAGDLAAELAMSQEAVVDRDARLEALLKRVQAQEAELAALKKKPAPTSAIGRVALVKKAVPNPQAPKAPAAPAAPATPAAKKPAAPAPRPSAPPIVPGVELEVFELDIDEEAKDEELLDDMLILEDDEPLTPVKK